MPDDRAYYAQRYGTRDKLKATTAEAAIAEAKEMPGATGVVLITKEQIWQKSSTSPRRKAPEVSNVKRSMVS